MVVSILPACIALVLLFLTSNTFAQTTRPLLDQLNRETQSLYDQTAQGIVRVQLPMRTDALSMLSSNPLAKWQGQIDAQMLQRLNQAQQRAPNAQFTRVEIDPSAPQTASLPDQQQQRHIIILTLIGFWPNSMGAVIDDDGHVMIPHYVDREAFDQTIPVSLADGRHAQAEFVASDKQTEITILKLQNIKAKPISLAAARSPNGSLMLIHSLNPANNRLAVWTGGEPDLAMAITTDGDLAGFTINGRFRDAASCKPIAQELIANGQVRRAFLGVVIQTVPSDDPQRAQDPTLHNLPALRIKKIVPNSAADHAGLKENDLILKVATTEVADATTFAAAIAKCRGKTEMSILRDEQQITVDVDLEVQP